MRFLLIGKLTPAVAEAVTRHGHQVAPPDTIGLTEDSPPDEILRAAYQAQLEILTADPDLAEAPYQHEVRFSGRCLVFLQLAGGDLEQDDAIDRLFDRYKRLSPGRLYTVTETRVKVRQLKTK